jgi:hypothetical protein
MLQFRLVVYLFSLKGRLSGRTLVENKYIDRRAEERRPLSEVLLRKIGYICVVISNSRLPVFAQGSPFRTHLGRKQTHRPATKKTNPR